jgi:hypothetical protein
MLWNDLEDLQKKTRSNPRETTSRDFFESRAAALGPTSPLSLLGPAFQQLMSRVVDELRSAGFVLQTDLHAGLSAWGTFNILDQLSGLSSQVSNIEQDLKDPGGTFARLKGRVKALKDRRAEDAIECKGKTL